MMANDMPVFGSSRYYIPTSRFCPVNALTQTKRFWRTIYQNLFASTDLRGFETCQVYALLRLLSSATPKTASIASVTNPTHDGNSSPFTDTAVPLTGGGAISQNAP